MHLNTVVLDQNAVAHLAQLEALGIAEFLRAFYYPLVVQQFG